MQLQRHPINVCSGCKLQRQHAFHRKGSNNRNQALEQANQATTWVMFLNSMAVIAYLEPLVLVDICFPIPSIQNAIGRTNIYRKVPNK